MDFNKEEDFKFIKDFSNISVRQICIELGIDYTNLIKGKSSAEKTKLVKERIIQDLLKLEGLQ